MTIAIVPPHTWHPIHTDQPNQMVTECYHTNPGHIMLTISNNGHVTPTHQPPPPCGYKTRTIPWEDHTYQQLCNQHQPPTTSQQQPSTP